MQLPETFECGSAKNKVILLHKALYGPKQASRTSNKAVHDTLVQLGLKQLDYEPCVYFKREKDDLLIIALYVDDFLVMYNSEKMSVNLKRELMIKFKMEDLGDVKLCLGIRIQRDKLKSTYALDQTHYIKELVNKFNVENGNSIRTIEVNLDLPRNYSNELPNVPYQSLKGSLMYSYVAVCTRPDVAYAVNYLSQFNTCYSMAHWNCAKRVLRYLKSTFFLSSQFYNLYKYIQ
jgi:hypothetical protein